MTAVLAVEVGVALWTEGAGGRIVHKTSRHSPPCAANHSSAVLIQSISLLGCARQRKDPSGSCPCEVHIGAGQHEEVLNHSPAEWCHHGVGASEGSQ